MLVMHSVPTNSLQMWTDSFGDPPHHNKTTGWLE